MYSLKFASSLLFPFKSVAKSVLVLKIPSEFDYSLIQHYIICDMLNLTERRVMTRHFLFDIRQKTHHFLILLYVDCVFLHLKGLYYTFLQFLLLICIEAAGWFFQNNFLCILVYQVTAFCII